MALPPANKLIEGWQDIYRQTYPEIGNRWMANCDIPDLDLLPSHYKINEIHFSAGMESRFLHFSIWLTSWLVRLKLPIKLAKHAKFLLKLSHCMVSCCQSWRWAANSYYSCCNTS